MRQASLGCSNDNFCSLFPSAQGHDTIIERLFVFLWFVSYIYFGRQLAPFTQRLLFSAELNVSDSFCELEIILLRASSLCSIRTLYFFTWPSLVSISSCKRCFSRCNCMIYSSSWLTCMRYCITSLLISSRRWRNSCTLPFN